ncbi:MAG: GNAT family N-acetyltransferase [Acidimicrobiia bacterium]|nr:GNAT family N-acetyltransferase [Acidimicrobiia bacterium]
MPIRPLVHDDAAACRDLLDSLPQWFGDPSSNQAYIEALHQRRGFVAVDRDDVIRGFLALETHTPTSVEIAVMAVDRDHHRAGLGRALVEAAIDDCRRRQVRWLHVKTRGPSTYDDSYERTRRFYRAMGFEPLYESRTEWGADDAALVQVMVLDAD